MIEVEDTKMYDFKVDVTEVKISINWGYHHATYSLFFIEKVYKNSSLKFSSKQGRV